MNDFLAKPVNQKVLGEMLAKWLGPAREPAPEPETSDVSGIGA
jgi:hypothetical protein